MPQHISAYVSVRALRSNLSSLTLTWHMVQPLHSFRNRRGTLWWYSFSNGWTLSVSIYGCWWI